MSAADAAAEAARWLAYAEDDVRAARGLAAMADVKPGQACYHAQQAAEKALKATLVLAAVSLPRSHDLVLLSGLAPAGWNVAQLPPADLGALGRWLQEGRYPDVPGAFGATPAEAQAALTFADQVVEAAKKDLVDHA